MVSNDIKDLISRNEGVDFVFHVRSEQELNVLVDALEELDFEFAIPFLGTVREMAAQFSAEYGFDGCWRVSRERGVAYNPSVEHWRLFCGDIVEFGSEGICFNEGYTNEEDAKIEAEKLRQAFYGEDAENTRMIFRMTDADDEQIERFIKEHTAIKE